MEAVIDLRGGGGDGTRARCATRCATIGEAETSTRSGANASQLVRVSVPPPRHYILSSISSSSWEESIQRFVWDQRNQVVGVCMNAPLGLGVAGLDLLANDSYGEAEEAEIEVQEDRSRPDVGDDRRRGLPESERRDVAHAPLRSARRAPAHEGEPALESENPAGPSEIRIVRARRARRLGVLPRRQGDARRKALTARFQGSHRKTGRVREPRDPSLERRGRSAEHGGSFSEAMPCRLPLAVPFMDVQRLALLGRSSTLFHFGPIRPSRSWCACARCS